MKYFCRSRLVIEMRRWSPFKAWSQEDMEEALRRVKLGEMSIRAAAREYDIPNSTLQDKVHGRTPINSRQGRSPYLTRAEEERIVNWAIQMARVGLGQTKDDIKNVVKHILDRDGRPNPFRNNRPGDKWFDGFQARNTRLSMRRPQPIGKERAIVTPARINRWFDNLEDYLLENEACSVLYEPERLFNCDESGFALGGKSRNRVLAERGAKVVHEIKNSDKAQITVLATVSAAGTFLPPVLVLPGSGENTAGKSQQMEGAPEGALFAWTKNGWMDSKAFYDYIANLFYPRLIESGVRLPVLLLVDGHSTHQSPEVSEFCSTHGIILYRFPPNATHVLQPCDLSLFRSLKAAWYSVERRYRLENPGDYVTKRTFASIFRGAWDKVTAKPSLAINGFKAAGIFPYTRGFNEEQLVPATLYNFQMTTDCELPQDDITISTGVPSFLTQEDCMTQLDTPSTSAAMPGEPEAQLMERPTDQTFVSPALDEFLHFPKITVSPKGKKRKQLPEAISGVEFQAHLREKEEKQREEEERKRLRREEREEKRLEREKQRKKDEELKQQMREERERKRMAMQRLTEQWVIEAWAEEELGKNLGMKLKLERTSSNESTSSYDSMSTTESISSTPSTTSIKKESINENICTECELDYRNDEKWIGCDFCSRWLHLHCSELNGLTEEEIHATSYKCNHCLD